MQARRDRVLIVEDDAQTGQNFHRIVAALEGIESVCVSRTLKEARENASDSWPDIVLLDMGLPDGNGLDFISWLHAAHAETETQIVIITIFDDDATLLSAIEAGACGYILKDDNAFSVTDVLNIVRNGGSPISPPVAKRLLSRFTNEGRESRRDSNKGAATATSETVPGLTPRENQILTLVSYGFTDQEIAHKESISYHTVTTHVKNIYKKLNVSTRVQATRHIIDNR